MPSTNDEHTHIPLLHCPRSGLNLPTPDPESLSVLCYLRLCGVVFQRAEVDIGSMEQPPLLASIPRLQFGSSASDNTSTAALPLLSVSQVRKTGFENIVRFCGSQGFDLDLKRAPAQRSEIRVFESLVQEKLYPVLCWWWWCNRSNFGAIRKHFYANAGLIGGLIMPRVQARHAANLCRRYGIENREQVRMEERRIDFNSFISCLALTMLDHSIW